MRSESNLLRFALLARLLSFSFLISMGAAALASPSTPRQDYEMALEAQTSRNYVEMVRLLRRAAEQNHVPAQELLAIALLHGERMSNQQVDLDLCESLAWFRKASAAGSPLGRFYQDFLNREVRHGASRC